MTPIARIYVRGNAFIRAKILTDCGTVPFRLLRNCRAILAYFRHCRRNVLYVFLAIEWHYRR